MTLPFEWYASQLISSSAFKCLVNTHFVVGSGPPLVSIIWRGQFPPTLHDRVAHSRLELVSAMADTRSLAHLGASTSDAARLSARGVRTAADLMRTDLLDVADALRVSVPEASRALCRVAKAVAPAATDAASLRRKDASGHLPTKLSPLDEAMRGGLPARAITELAGPAGAGKTQMCFALLLSAALPTRHGGKERCAVYVDAERKFSAKRVAEMARAWTGSSMQESEVQMTLARMRVVPPPERVEDMAPLLLGLEQMMIQDRVAVVVVDSVAVLMRGDASRRHDVLGAQASALRHLAESFNVPVVVTNQVVGGGASLGSHQMFGAIASEGGEAEVAAALGVRWAHAVHTRLTLSRTTTCRCLTVAKSPCLPPLRFSFRITTAGLVHHPSDEANLPPL